MPDYADRRVLWVIGYPRSGTTWAARLLGYTLHCPVLSLSHEYDYLDDPVVSGMDLDGQWVVRRAHWNIPGSPIDGPQYNPTKDKILHVARDPRGVSISCYHHFTFNHGEPCALAKCVRQLCGLEPGPPLTWNGNTRSGWPGYISDWLDFEDSMKKKRKVTHVRHTRYIDLYSKGAISLQSLLSQMRIPFDEARTHEAIEVYRFDRSPKDRLMRRGEAGKWHEELPPDLEAIILQQCGDVMARLRYV